MNRAATRIAFGLAAFGMGLASLPSPSVAADKVLRILSWGGILQDNQRKAFFEPFTKETGIKIVEDTYNGELGKVSAMVAAGKVETDLVNSNPQIMLAACDEGILETIKLNQIGNPKPQDFMDYTFMDCGVSTNIYTFLWAWNGDVRKPDAGPQNIAGIFDPVKYPGSRAMRQRPFATLEWALMADGVKPAEVYKVLGTPAGLDRGLAVFNKIKKGIVWTASNSQGVERLVDKEVDYSALPSNRVYDAMYVAKKNIVPLWDAQIYSHDTWIIPKGAVNKDAALKFIEFSLRSDVEANYAELTSMPPARKDAIQKVKSDIREKLASAHFRNELAMDYTFWAQNLDHYTKRFTAWAQQ